MTMPVLAALAASGKLKSSVAATMCSALRTRVSANMDLQKQKIPCAHRRAVLLVAIGGIPVGGRTGLLPENVTVSIPVFLDQVRRISERHRMTADSNRRDLESGIELDLRNRL